MKSSPHNFHIPVMGLGFTIDTPLKVAKYGINSTVSIMDNELVETVRQSICEEYNLQFVAVTQNDTDFQAERVTKYLNTLVEIIALQEQEIRELRGKAWEVIRKYIQLLPDKSGLKQLYNNILASNGCDVVQAYEAVSKAIVFGQVEVNIMTKIDQPKYFKDGSCQDINASPARAALRGFANSKLNSSVVFSAGLNARLYSYCEEFADFFPVHKQAPLKTIIIKVSDYRSALIQGKLLAKKGLWVSEFRIESGINCGGHLFITDGSLLGTVLEEFRNNREALFAELQSIYIEGLHAKGFDTQDIYVPSLRITVQGGVGTKAENDFLQNYYNVDSVGWGSPFLLVPEATNVDVETLGKLANAKSEDYYISNSSPLGIPFSNFKNSSSNLQRFQRIERNRPGSPCYKNYLANNTQYSTESLCIASRAFQIANIKAISAKNLSKEQYESEVEAIVEKECLCEGLSASAHIVRKAPLSHGLKAVSICPGPNLAYFSGIRSLQEMVDHIYGRVNLISKERPSMFLNEIVLYINYFKKEFDRRKVEVSAHKIDFETVKKKISGGIEYYEQLCKNSTLAKLILSARDVAHLSAIKIELQTAFE